MRTLQSSIAVTVLACICMVTTVLLLLNFTMTNQETLRDFIQNQRHSADSNSKLVESSEAKGEKDKTQSVPMYLQVERELRPRRNVFFDLGANRGDSTLQFTGVEKDSEVGGKLSEQVFQIPKRIPGPWDIRMYEAHPRFDQQLLETKAIVESLDPKEFGGPFHVYSFNNTAIGWEEGMIDFFLDVRSSVKWGSSLFKDHPDINTTDSTSIIRVPIHDLTREIMNNYRISDYVVVKMDIEGIEYELLLEMLLRGVFPYIDELYVEYHTFADKNKDMDCVRWKVLERAKKYMFVGDWQ